MRSVVQVVYQSVFYLLSFMLSYALVDKNNVKLKLDGFEIAKVTSACFLGVIVDEKCSWKEHINYVTKKVSKSLGIIKKIS